MPVSCVSTKVRMRCAAGVFAPSVQSISRLAVGKPSWALPRPKPWTTAPVSASGVPSRRSVRATCWAIGWMALHDGVSVVSQSTAFGLALHDGVRIAAVLARVHWIEDSFCWR